MKTRSFSLADVAVWTGTGSSCTIPRLLGLLGLAGALCGQPSITDTAQPFIGPVVFDDAGNSYGMLGPVSDGAYQTQPGGGACQSAAGPGLLPCPDAYAGKADAAGNLVWGTRLGGSTSDRSTALAVDQSGNVFVGGQTGGDFPVTSGGALANLTDARTFAAKLSTDGKQLLYATYLPTASSTVSAMATDPQGNLYVAGASSQAGYVIKLNSAGSALLFDRLLPGPATAMTRDGQGNILVTGYSGEDMAADGYIAKLDPTGAVFFIRTFGGTLSDMPTAIQADGFGEIYIAGTTMSLDLPTTLGIVRARPIVPLSNTFGPGGFVAKLSSDGSLVRWSTYVPIVDRQQIGVFGLAVTPAGDLYLSGQAAAGFPVTTTGARPCFEGGMFLTSAFAVRMSNQGILQDATYLGEGAAYGLAASNDAVRVAWRSNGAGNTNSLVKFGAGTPASCLSKSVLNAATSWGNDSISPGEMISLTGFGIGPETGVVYQPNGQGLVPTTTGEVQVLVNDRPIPVLYAQSRQVNAIVPMDLPFRTTGDSVKATVKLLYRGTQIGSTIDVNVGFGTPGLFRQDVGYSNRAAAINQDGTVNGPDHPAPKGSVIALWGTGFGRGNPACTSGDLNLPRPTGPLPNMSAYLSPGLIFPGVYVGSAPGMLCGVTQLNVRIPETAGSGTIYARPTSEATEGGSTIVSTSDVGSAIFVQ